jgi:hypothetical protein
LIPYDFKGVPHNIWLKALKLSRGDVKTAKKAARLLDPETLPVIEEGERMLGATATLRCLLQGGLHVLLSKIEEKRFGPLKGKKKRKRTIFTAKSSPQRNLGIISAPATSDTGLLLKNRLGRESWLGLCGDDRVIWIVNGERISNEVVAEETLRLASKEGVELPHDGTVAFLKELIAKARAERRISLTQGLEEIRKVSIPFPQPSTISGRDMSRASSTSYD